MTSFPDVITGPYVEFGGCWNGMAKEDAHCQIGKSGCEILDVNGNVKPPFRSALQMRENGYDDNNMHCHARQVDARHGAPIKRCDLLDVCQVGDCHGDGKTTSSSTTDCNLVQDQNENTATLFGACRNTGGGYFVGCYFSEADCQTNEEFVSPDQLFRHFYDEKPFCDCTEVKVGLCTDDDFAACAVSEESCGPDERFISAREIHTRPDLYGDIDCRLCRPDALADSTRARTVAVIKERRADLAEGSGHGGAVALAVILSLLAVGAVIAAFYYYRRNKDSGIDRSADRDIKPYKDTMDEEDDFANAHMEHGAVGMTNIDLNGSGDDEIMVLPAENRQLD